MWIIIVAVVECTRHNTARLHSFIFTGWLNGKPIKCKSKHENKGWNFLSIRNEFVLCASATNIQKKVSFLLVGVRVTLRKLHSHGETLNCLKMLLGDVGNRNSTTTKLHAVELRMNLICHSPTSIHLIRSGLRALVRPTILPKLRGKNAISSHFVLLLFERCVHCV